MRRWTTEEINLIREFLETHFSAKRTVGEVLEVIKPKDLNKKVKYF